MPGGAPGSRGEGPLALFRSFTKAKLLEPNMKFQSWPLGDKHIFFTFCVGVFPGEGGVGDLPLLFLSAGSTPELCLPVPVPTRTLFSIALERFALSETQEQEWCSACSPERSASWAGLLQGISPAQTASPLAPLLAWRQRLAGPWVLSFGAGAGSCPPPCSPQPSSLKESVNLSAPNTSVRNQNELMKLE